MMIICHHEGNARLMEVLKISRNTLVEDYYRVLKRKVYQLGPFLIETICDNTLLSQKYQYWEIYTGKPSRLRRYIDDISGKLNMLMNPTVP